MKNSILLILFGTFLSGAASTVFAQVSHLDRALSHLRQEADQWGLQAADLSDLALTDQQYDRHSSLTHLYFQQRLNGVPIRQAILSVHLRPDGTILHAAGRAVPRLAQRTVAAAPTIDARAAVQAALRPLKVAARSAPRLLRQASAHDQVFALDDIARNEVRVRLLYLYDETTDQLQLAWHVPLDQAGSADYWSLTVDAQSGQVLTQDNYTVYCRPTAAAKRTHVHTTACAKADVTASLPAAPPVLAGASYHVFPLPTESPLAGKRQLLTEPADAEASPFGWHDTNGQPGAEYTITRGNNVHAYSDAANADKSAKDEPDGGAELRFDFYFDPNGTADTLRAASVTQLFYTNNIMHDFAYHYGFDEANGNFQARNYSGAPGGSDALRAEAQDGGDTDNANFSTPPDGEAPRMQMYLWNNGGRALQIEGGEGVGGSYQTGRADFGPAVSTVPVTGNVVIARDGSANPELVCQAVANATAVAGKIALLRRGDCFFERKVANAEAAGAIGVIVCNPANTILTMAGTSEVPDPKIPAVLIRESDCQRIRLAIEQGQPVVASLVHKGPSMIDASFDNGVIAHEYAHGITNRLVGGKSSVDCLFNDEQMGEGWSDFYSLALTVSADDVPARARGIGTYVAGQDAGGPGIRSRPYTTDMAINGLTYDDIITTGNSPHALGEIWATTLWDLYWALVDRYGFDNDLYFGTGGNNRALHLVTEGLKFTPCQPGLVDGRDAIVAADYALYGGDNECLIWEVFARRGIGLGADQGSTRRRGDNREDYATLPECIKTLKLAKTSNRSLIKAGDTVTFTLELVNHKDETLTGLTLTDALPAGLTYLAGSATGAIATPGAAALTFRVEALPTAQPLTITYRAVSDPRQASTRYYFDGAEAGDFDWAILPLAGKQVWQIADTNQYAGDHAWFVPDTEEANDQVLQTFQTFVAEGRRPALRFYHRYATEAGWDGGIVQYSTGGDKWQSTQQRMIRNGYRGEIHETSFGSPGVEAYWGDSKGYLDTYIDLSDLRGQDLAFRWRFVSDEAVAAEGWYVDNIELIDLFSYEGEACVVTAEGDRVCARVPQGGVIVDTASDPTGIRPPVLPATEVQVVPNPAADQFRVFLQTAITQQVAVHLLTADGRRVREERMQLLPGTAQAAFSTADLPRGLYFLQVRGQEGVITRKVLLQ